MTNKQTGNFTDTDDYYAGNPQHGLFNLGQRIRPARPNRRISNEKPGRRAKVVKQVKEPPRCRGCKKTLAHGNARWCSDLCRSVVIAQRDLATVNKTLPRYGQRRNCKCCGAEFIIHSTKHIYCSDACRNIAACAASQKRSKPKNPRRLYLCDIHGQKTELREIELLKWAQSRRAKYLKTNDK